MEKKIFNFNLNEINIPVEVVHEDKENFTKWLEAIVNVMDIESNLIHITYHKALSIYDRENNLISIDECLILDRGNSLQIVKVTADSQYAMLKDLLKYLTCDQIWAYNYDSKNEIIYIY